MKVSPEGLSAQGIFVQLKTARFLSLDAPARFFLLKKKEKLLFRTLDILLKRFAINFRRSDQAELWTHTIRCE